MGTIIRSKDLYHNAAKMGTTFKGRRWKNVDGGVWLESALALKFGQSQHSDPKHCTRALWGCCLEASHEGHVCRQVWASAGMLAPSTNHAGYSEQGLSHGWAQALQLIQRAWGNMCWITYQSTVCPEGVPMYGKPREKFLGWNKG